MNKKTMSYHLTPSERAIMDILWHEKSSMSQSAIIDKAKESGTMAWKERSIFSMINSLLEKGIIEEDSFIRSGKTYARTFKPTTSRAEFYAHLVFDGLTEKELREFKSCLRSLSAGNAADVQPQDDDKVAE
jgi:predicted transcriptional regulator